MTKQGGQFMKKTTLAILAGLTMIAGNSFATDFGTAGPFVTEVTVTENLQFSAVLEEGKADGSCCLTTDPTSLEFDLAANTDGTLGARPMYTFINVATNSQPYDVQYSATDLSTSGGTDLDQTFVFTKLISATTGTTDLTGLTGASTMTDRQLSTGGAKVTIFGSPTAGQSAQVQVITAINGYTATGKQFDAGNVPDGNTPAGVYSGTVTYSAVLR
ncbi:MAG: hypothetical protein KC649_00520 [Candidatus Omnitrophica bacterium]|nr:hypothetical protein [Candidatus Omnitrophota bacterium]